jgi:membrane protein YdbS with pleckstrin-like domain
VGPRGKARAARNAHIGVVTDPINPSRPASLPSLPLEASAASGTAAAQSAYSSATSSVADGVDHRLDPRYLLLQRRRGWIRAIAYPLFWLGIVTAGLGLYAFRDYVIAPTYAIWALCSLAYIIWSIRRPVIAYRHASYRLDAQGIEIREGVIWRRVINVPRSRVQHIDVSQGPFERRHGIGTLSIYTAGVSHAMVSLPGLDHGVALRIRDYLLPQRGDAGV